MLLSPLIESARPSSGSESCYPNAKKGRKRERGDREILASFERFPSNDRRTDIAGLNNLYQRWKLRTWPRLFANVEKEDI